VKPGTSSRTHGKMGWTKWQRGKSTNFKASQRLPGGLLKASWSFIHCMATAKETAMCNDINYA